MICYRGRRVVLTGCSRNDCLEHSTSISVTQSDDRVRLKRRITLCVCAVSSHFKVLILRLENTHARYQNRDLNDVSARRSSSFFLIVLAKWEISEEHERSSVFSKFVISTAKRLTRFGLCTMIESDSTYNAQ